MFFQQYVNINSTPNLTHVLHILSKYNYVHDKSFIFGHI